MTVWAIRLRHHHPRVQDAIVNNPTDSLHHISDHDLNLLQLVMDDANAHT